MSSTGDLTRVIGDRVAGHPRDPCRDCPHRLEDHGGQEGQCVKCACAGWAPMVVAATPPPLVIHPHDIIGNEQARSVAAHYLGQATPVTRNSLLKWREKRGFPQPLDTPRAGVELWDAREVRAWCEKHARTRVMGRPQQDQGPDPSERI